MDHGIDVPFLCRRPVPTQSFALVLSDAPSGSISDREAEHGSVIAELRGLAQPFLGVCVGKCRIDVRGTSPKWCSLEWCSLLEILHTNRPLSIPPG
jgi:hypothetical protein